MTNLPDWLQRLLDEDAPGAEIAREIYLPDPDNPDWFCEDRPAEELEDPKDRRETGTYLTWLADALRAGGCRVIEHPGWKTRGHGPMRDIRGTLNHHTGGGGVNDWQVVLHGRSDLPGPLAHMTLEKDGAFRLIAAGRCWHAGSGGPLGPVPAGEGNNHLIGFEGVSNGSTWTEEQRREYPKGVAALLRWTRLGADRTWDHKEWTRRKIDRGVWDPNSFRRDVGHILHGEEEDLKQDERNALFDILGQLSGSRALGQWPGWPSRVDPNSRLTPVDFITYIDKTAHEARAAAVEARDLMREVKDLVTKHLADEEASSDPLIARLAEGYVDEAGVQHKILIPEILVSEARRERCPVAAGAVLLMKESSGGRNLYGHDRGACMSFRDPWRDVAVTRWNYENEYLPCVKAGGKRNGVGPGQLTWWELQEEADREGGCWDPRVNVRIMCRHFMACVRVEGSNIVTRAGDYEAAFGRYRGGPNWRHSEAAVKYAADAQSRLPRWEEVVLGINTGGTT